MVIESTLKVFNEADLEGRPRPGVPGQVMKMLVGRQTPTERMNVALGNFTPGTYAPLHWHFVEVFYYVISGRAVVKDINGKAYNAGPGSVIYAEPGIAGAHSYDIKEPMKLLAVRATTDPEKTLNIVIDDQTKETRIKIETLVRRGVAKFSKSLY